MNTVPRGPIPPNPDVRIRFTYAHPVHGEHVTDPVRAIDARRIIAAEKGRYPAGIVSARIIPADHPHPSRKD